MAFDRVIVATLIPAWPLLDGEENPAVLNESVQSVACAIANAPFHIRLAVGGATFIIGLCIVLISAGAAGPLATALRVDGFYRLLQRLPGPASSVVRLYRSMTLLTFYERPPVAAKLLSVGPA